MTQNIHILASVLVAVSSTIPVFGMNYINGKRLRNNSLWDVPMFVFMTICFSILIYIWLICWQNMVVSIFGLCYYFATLCPVIDSIKLFKNKIVKI